MFIFGGCKSNSATNEGTTPAEVVTPSIVPTEIPESYQNDIEDYEPTDSLSQDSDGPVH